MNHEPISPEDLEHFRRKMRLAIADSLRERGCQPCAHELVREWVKVTMQVAIESGAVARYQFELTRAEPHPNPAKQRLDELTATALARELLEQAKKGE